MTDYYQHRCEAPMKTLISLLMTSILLLGSATALAGGHKSKAPKGGDNTNQEQGKGDKDIEEIEEIEDLMN